MAKAKTRVAKVADPMEGKRVDRRIQRTRQLLQQAFQEVSQEKPFADISVQDVTERANVNRGTFYAHYTDKYALLDAVIREGFQKVIAGTLTRESRWDRATLQRLIQTVLKHVKSIRTGCNLPPNLAPMHERAIYEELTEVFTRWLKQQPRGEIVWRVPVQTIATVVSWAILGAATQWSCTSSAKISAERMAEDVFTVVMDGVTSLSGGVLPVPQSA